MPASSLCLQEPCVRRLAYSAITICQLLVFSTVWEPEAHIYTTNPGKEQVKTECTQTQECERWIGRNPIFKLKHRVWWEFSCFETILGLFICFLLSSVCSEFQTGKKEPRSTAPGDKVLVCPKTNNQCLWSISSSKASARHPLISPRRGALGRFHRQTQPLTQRAHTQGSWLNFGCNFSQVAH